MRLLIAALSAVALLVLLSLGTADATTPGVARFRETIVTHHHGDGLAGSVETWRTRVWLPRRNKIIGTGVLSCIRVNDRSSIRECVGTYILPRGRVQVAGEIINLAGYQLTVTGGTGLYSGAGGLALFDDQAHETLIVFFFV